VYPSIRRRGRARKSPEEKKKSGDSPGMYGSWGPALPPAPQPKYNFPVGTIPGRTGHTGSGRIQPGPGVVVATCSREAKMCSARIWPSRHHTPKRLGRAFQSAIATHTSAILQQPAIGSPDQPGTSVFRDDRPKQVYPSEDNHGTTSGIKWRVTSPPEDD